MSALSELRTHSGISGAVVAALLELEARIAAFEAHLPMLEEMKREYEQFKARDAEFRAEAQSQPQPEPAIPPAPPAAD